MRVVLVLAALSAVAYTTDQKWLGIIVLLFILGCSLFGVGQACVDLISGRSNFERHLQSLPVNFNPCYYNLRRRGVSHEDCLRQGEPPLRGDDYFEKKVAMLAREVGKKYEQ
jgi:hypothetical protein